MTDKTASLAQIRAMKERGELMPPKDNAPKHDMPEGFWDGATMTHHTDTSPRRWHAQSNTALRDSFDTIDAHQRRVCSMCISLAAFIGHSITGSELPWAARHHDEAERFLGDMPAPAKARFPMLAEQYAIAERQILAEMSLSWTLTAKEQQMLHLCDKLDATHGRASMAHAGRNGMPRM